MAGLLELHRLSPEDLNLPFECQTFLVEDRAKPGRLKIAAWWIGKENSNQTIVLVHGYSDAKVGAIAWAPMLRDLGFNLLVPDLRAHGESEGTYCTAGYWERHDLMQIIDQLRAAHPRQTATRGAVWHQPGRGGGGGHGSDAPTIWPRWCWNARLLITARRCAIRLIGYPCRGRCFKI